MASPRDAEWVLLDRVAAALPRSFVELAAACAARSALERAGLSDDERIDRALGAWVARAYRCQLGREPPRASGRRPAREHPEVNAAFGVIAERPADVVAMLDRVGGFGPDRALVEYARCLDAAVDAFWWHPRSRPEAMLRVAYEVLPLLDAVALGLGVASYARAAAGLDDDRVERVLGRVAEVVRRRPGPEDSAWTNLRVETNLAGGAALERGRIPDRVGFDASDAAYLLGLAALNQPWRLPDVAFAATSAVAGGATGAAFRDAGHEVADVLRRAAPGAIGADRPDVMAALVRAREAREDQA